MVSVIGVVVNQNTYNIWQTALALVIIVASIGGGFMEMNKRLAKKSDIEKINETISNFQEGNTKENTRIIAIVEEIKEDIKTNENRLIRHIEFGTHARGVQRNPLDGQNDE